MEIQGWEHRAASRSPDLRLLLADQAVEICDLTGRLDRSPRQQDNLRDDNDHLIREMALAGSEIHQFQSQIHDLKRNLEGAQAASMAADESLDRLCDELRLTQEEVDTELQRDKAATEWADATRTQTELESKVRRMKAETTSTQLQDQLATARISNQQLFLERDRSLSERDMARRRLTLVAVAITDLLSAQTGLPPATNASASQQSLGGADPSAAKRPRSASPASGAGSSHPHKKTRTSSPARFPAKAKSQVCYVAKVASKAGSSVPTSKQVPVAAVSTKSGFKTGSAAKSSVASWKP
ncbi:hypothetical protein PInf_017847 [Phytophthora infestans]|nr:hypothetical protein PInf_017847 [Phytophthora infestans]